MANRFACDILKEMRACYKVYNFAHLRALIEEMQTIVNRMEAALYDQKELEHLYHEIRTKKRELKVLERKIEDLEAELEVEPD
jgi:predicted  nucleic acid-binding Zn-ribbon protein